MRLVDPVPHLFYRHHCASPLQFTGTPLCHIFRELGTGILDWQEYIITFGVQNPASAKIGFGGVWHQE